MSTAVKLKPPSKIRASEEALDVYSRRIRLGNRPMRADVAQAVTDVAIDYTMEAASTLTIGLHDPDNFFIQQSWLKKGLECSLLRTDGKGWDLFNLVAVSKTDSIYTLTFEDHYVALLRLYTQRIKASRNTVTRAEFIFGLIKRLGRLRPLFWSPEIHDKQIVAISDEQRNDAFDKTKQKDSLLVDSDNRPYAIDANENVHVKGASADAEQRSNLELILTVGIEIHAPKKVLLSAVITAIEESTVHNLSGGDRDSVGVFQQRKSMGWTGLNDVKKAAKQYYLGKNEDGSGGAVRVMREHPSHQAYWIACEVQRNKSWKSSRPDRMGQDTYGRWMKEGKDIMEAFLGVDASTYRGDIDRKSKIKTASYDFTVGQPDNPDVAESFWGAIVRMADEVQWRAFAYRGVIYYASDDYLSTLKPRVILTKDTDGVTAVDFGWDSGDDQGDKISEVELQVDAERWAAPPGSVIRLRGYGADVDNVRWLVSSFSRSLFSTQASITLIEPRPPKPEPAADLQSQTVNLDTGSVLGGPDDEATVRGRIVSLAKQYVGVDKFHYNRQAGRRIYHTFDGPGPFQTDCSGFATTIYEMAGAPDPNGFKYNGQGSTSPQFKHGKPVSDPQPGDLVFYGAPVAAGGGAHVGIYIGDNELVDFGSGTHPKRKRFKGAGARTDYAGNRSYFG